MGFCATKIYEKIKSSVFFKKAMGFICGVISYIILYILLKYILSYLPDFSPWNDFEIWIKISRVEFIRIDIIYFIIGLVIFCYGTIRLIEITFQNHSVKDKDRNKPAKLLRDGYYGKVRHPMYGTFIILQVGFFLSLRSAIGIVLGFIFLTIQYINASVEEKKDLIPIFGYEYTNYRNKVKHMLLRNTEIIILSVFAIFGICGFIF